MRARGMRDLAWPQRPRRPPHPPLCTVVGVPVRTRRATREGPGHLRRCPGPSGSVELRRLRADLEPREAGDGQTRILRDVADDELVVARVVLLKKRDLLEERAEATLDDLREGGIRLALLAADLLDDATLV